MKITFNLNLELTLNEVNIEGIQSTHEHICEKDSRKHNDVDSIDKISGEASLKGGMDLTFDMSEEEMKACYGMIENLGKEFSNRGQKIVEHAQRFVDKVNESSEDKQPAESEHESEIIAKNEEFKRLLDRYNTKPNKAAFEKANVFGRRLEGEIETYLNETDSPLAEIEEIYEEVCTKRKETRQAEAARS